MTGLTRSEYLSLIAAVDLIMDPVTEDGGGLESALMPTLEALMIGTPVVTLHPDEKVRGWDRMQPTSTVAGVIRAVGDGSMEKRCIASTLQAYDAGSRAARAGESHRKCCDVCAGQGADSRLVEETECRRGQCMGWVSPARWPAIRRLAG